ncbi:MAG: polymer-forming cytoskeletal protein [Nitrospinae bacterium]|nr:polymer-forming cytoskeletal protein [Nitrospinota bacterium]
MAVFNRNREANNKLSLTSPFGGGKTKEKLTKVTKGFFERDRETNNDASFNSFFDTGISMKGTLDFRGTVRFDGKFEGEIRSDGTLVIGDDGVINAKIKAGYIVSSGKIVGDIQAAKSVSIYPKSKLKGNIETPDLQVYSGACFDGNCKMVGVVASPDSLPVIIDERIDYSEEVIPSENLEVPKKVAKRPVPMIAAIALLSILFLWLLFAKVDLGRFGHILGFYAPKELVEQGLSFYNAGQEKEALAKFRRASFMNFNDYNLHLTLAQSFDGLNKDREALSEYKKVVNLNGAYREEFIRFLIRRDMPEEAVEQLKIYISDNPDNIKSHFELVGLYKKMGNEDDLYLEYVKLIKLLPKNEEIVTDMLRIELAKGWNDKALESYARIIKLDSGNPSIRLAYANLLFVNGREQSAAAEFSALVKLLPGHIEAENDKGFGYIESKMFPNAQQSFSAVLSNDSENLRAKYGQIMLYAKMWRIDEAITEAEKLLQLHPVAAPVLNRLAWLYYAKGINTEEAIKLAEKAVAINLKSDKYLDTLADLRYKNGEKEVAIDIIKKAIEINPTSAYYTGKLAKYQAE